jgi:hypothetical protein
MDRYKDMAGSKGKMFTLQHCYKLLEHSEKWKIRDREAPPARGALVELDDEEEDDELNAIKNKKRPMVSRRRKISSRSKRSRQALETRWTI